MKNVLSALLIVLIPMMFASCGGGASSEGLVGKWQVDATSFDLVLGDGVPEMMKTAIEAQKSEAMEKAEAQSSDVTLEFTKEGKAILSKKGDDDKPELNYSFDGSKLNLNGEIEGEKVDVDLTISEVTANKFTIAMTGEEIYAQVKAKYPEMLEKAGPMDFEPMVKGCKVAISFKK